MELCRSSFPSKTAELVIVKSDLSHDNAYPRISRVLFKTIFRGILLFLGAKGLEKISTRTQRLIRNEQLSICQTTAMLVS